VASLDGVMGVLLYGIFSASICLPQPLLVLIFLRRERETKKERWCPIATVAPEKILPFSQQQGFRVIPLVGRLIVQLLLLLKKKKTSREKGKEERNFSFFDF
jgi:hypothetical protein